MKTVNFYQIAVFFIRQWNQLRDGKWPVQKRKLKLVLQIIIRLPPLIVTLPFAVLTILVIRIIRPFFLVRFQGLISWRIGHLAANTELYLCEMDAGINRPKIPSVDIWYYPTPPCNRQLAQMWNRKLHVGPKKLLMLIDKINAFIPSGDIHCIGNNTRESEDVYNLLDRFPTHLNFLPKEERYGEARLRKFGIPEGAQFVCLHVRDSSYLYDQSPHLDWSHHDYRDCNIQNYILAARKLVDRGYYVFRMGAVVKEAMEVDHPMIINYATNDMRTDFMDIYLSAKCAFCISNGSGIDAVSWAFRLPIVYVDFVPFGMMATSRSVFVYTTKKHWLRAEKRFMTFNEIFESDVGYFDNSNQYEKAGIDLIESTAEEIAAVVLEMEERLRGAWQPNEEDENLQRRFWDMFPKTKFHGEIRSRMGASFLQQHMDWLE